VLYDYDFGPNYLRNVGIMNIGSVDPNFAAADYCRTWKCYNWFWYYMNTHRRILLPNKEAKPKIRIQPFGAVTYKNFDALTQSSTQFDVGSNFS
jgi:hypothetical protein